MWSCKIFLTSKFSYLLFSNPTHKTKTWTANTWETTNSNPHGPIKLSSQLTTGVRLCCAFYQPQQTVQTFCAKLYSYAKPACFDFSSSNFYLQGHIRSTSGAALRLQLTRRSTNWFPGAGDIMIIWNVVVGLEACDMQSRCFSELWSTCPSKFGNLASCFQDLRLGLEFR
jgi:hypothetical protein